MEKRKPRTSEAQLRAGAKYDAVNTRMYSFKFNRKTDADILAKLETVDGVQTYIKQLIREDVLRQKS